MHSLFLRHPAQAERSYSARTSMAAGVLLVCGWVGLVPEAAAQDKPERLQLSEEDYLREIPIVLSATRLAQPLTETPAAMTIIDRQMIEASGARSIVDLFRFVPGLLVGYESGNRQVVTTHGFADVFARRMQVLIDGRSVYIPAYGGVPWSELPLALEDIEKIEVIRGPNAAAYGANSFLGVISITTRGARDERGTQVKLNTGTQSIRDGVVRTSDRRGDLDYQATLGYSQDNGFNLRYDRQQHQFASTALDYHLGSTDDIETRLGYSGGVNEKGYPGSLGNGPRDQQVISRFEQVRWRRDLGGGDNLALQFYHNYHESDEQFVMPPFPPFNVSIPINYDVTSERYDLELQNTFSIQRDWRSVWGLGWREDRVVAPGFFATTGAVENRMWRAFLNMEWRATRDLSVNAGAMWENDDISGSNVSPRLAFNYQLSPRQTLRAGVSRATRNPVLVEEQGNSRVCITSTCSIYDQAILSSGGLKPERILSREIGYLARPGGNLTLDLRAYHDKLSRLIAEYTRPYPDLDSEVQDFRNSDNANVNGLEAQLTYRPSFKDRLVLGYAYTHIKSSDIDNKYSASAPGDSGSLLWIRTLSDRYQASLAYYYVGSMRFLDAKRLQPVRRLDLRLARTYRIRNVHGDIALVFQNLLDGYDEYYPRTSTQNIFDTRAYVSFAVNLP